MARRYIVSQILCPVCSDLLDENEMAKERASTLEALHVMDAMDRRGDFAAAVDELRRVPFALSCTTQKLEEELGAVLFGRSGHRTKFTNVGRMLLERGCVLPEAAGRLTTDAETLARDWETRLTIVAEALVPTVAFFPLIDRLAGKTDTQLSVVTGVLAGAQKRLEQGRADIVIAPDMHLCSSSEINSRRLYSLMSVYVAAPDHPTHQEPEPLSEVTRIKYRGIVVTDTTRERPVLTVQLLDKQPRLTVSTIGDKRQALLAGLGVTTMSYPLVGEDIAAGQLRVVNLGSTSEINIIMTWRRDSIDKAKSWCLREIPKLFAGKQPDYSAGRGAIAPYPAYRRVYGVGMVVQGQRRNDYPLKFRFGS